MLNHEVDYKTSDYWLQPLERDFPAQNKQGWKSQQRIKTNWYTKLGSHYAIVVHFLFQMDTDRILAYLLNPTSHINCNVNQTLNKIMNQIMNIRRVVHLVIYVYKNKT